MKYNPLISVIVPVYNSGKYLRECIDSILAQTFSDFELILIDDGSTDSSPAICDEYASHDSRIHVIHQTNAGVSAARNAGIDAANGQYITFVDSDDSVSPKILETFNNNSNYDLVFVVSKNPQTNSLPNQTISTAREIGSLLESPASIFLRECWGKLFRKELLQTYNIRFKTNLSIGEDTIFVYEYITRITTIAVISDALYNYTIVSSSLSQDYSIINKNYEFFLDNLYSVLTGLKENIDYDINYVMFPCSDFILIKQCRYLLKNCNTTKSLIAEIKRLTNNPHINKLFTGNPYINTGFRGKISNYILRASSSFPFLGCVYFKFLRLINSVAY